MSDLVTFDSSQLDIIKTQFFPQNTTPADMNYCLGIAQSLGLNPITKEIWFIERKANVGGQWISKIEPMMGRDSFLKIAHQSNNFGGIETVAELKDIPKLENGQWTITKDLVATCKVFKKGIEKPFVTEVNYNEYVQKTKAGQPTKFWNEKPFTMLKKVAESQCLRKAFNISGVYDEAEIKDEVVDYEIKVNEAKEPTLDTSKMELGNKLKKDFNYDGVMIKAFAEYNELLNDKSKIDMLLNDEELLNNAVSNFESKGE